MGASSGRLSRQGFRSLAQGAGSVLCLCPVDRRTHKDGATSSKKAGGLTGSARTANRHGSTGMGKTRKRERKDHPQRKMEVNDRCISCGAKLRKDWLNDECESCSMDAIEPFDDDESIERDEEDLY